MTTTRPAPAHAAAPATNVAAIIAVSAGVISLFLLPIILGPVALTAGLVGESQARKEGRGHMKLAGVGILLGILGCVFAVRQIT